MTLNIKTPRSGEVVIAKELDGELYVPASTIAARDAQWLELVGPVVEALRKMLLWTDPEHDVLERARGEAEAALRAITEEHE